MNTLQTKITSKRFRVTRAGHNYINEPLGVIASDLELDFISQRLQNRTPETVVEKRTSFLGLPKTQHFSSVTDWRQCSDDHLEALRPMAYNF